MGLSSFRFFLWVRTDVVQVANRVAQLSTSVFVRRRLSFLVGTRFSGLFFLLHGYEKKTDSTPPSPSHWQDPVSRPEGVMFNDLVGGIQWVLLYV